MTRIIQDADLRVWEAYASPGPFGLPHPARIGFRCVSDARASPRAVPFIGDRSEAERVVREASADELRKMLERAVVAG
jgi:hypothetical protein